jgi:flagellar hook-associated protein 2
MAEGLDLGVSGLASGFDWRALVDQLADVERAPQRRLYVDQLSIQDRKSAYGSIATQLSVLKNRVADLRKDTLFSARTVGTSDEDLASATVSSGALLGRYAFHVDQLASAALRQGTTNIGSRLSATDDVSTLALSDAAFPLVVKAGTFTVNGKLITIATTDKLSDVFARIGTATGGDVTASYDSTTDRISLTSGSNSQIVLGSAVDTSNFLQAARLSNNGTSTVTSSSTLGSVRLTAKLTESNLATAVTNGGGAAGKFKINGVEISYDAATDSVADLLKRINESKAGVSASYDTVNDRFLLTNGATGDIGIALEDVTGNFLAAAGLSTGTFVRGQDLLYTVNGGGQLASHANTIGPESSGLTGLSVTARDEGDFTVTVSSDVEKIRKAITDFIDDYNRAQTLIDTKTASTTDAKGAVTAGILASESDAFGISSDLRRLVSKTTALATASLKRLDGLGIESNGNNNNLALADGAKLDAALASNLVDVQNLFLNETDGLAVKVDDYLESLVGEEGKLEKKESTLDKQIAELDRQISAQERVVLANRQRMIEQFVSMEKAQLQINQQLQFLQQRFSIN